MQQPVPKVTFADIRRMIRIDYPKALRSAVRGLLRQYGGRPHENEPKRVRIGCLKIANGSVRDLGKAVQAAKEDYRDIIMAAEYPGIARDHPNGDFTSAAEADMINDDWRQLQAWLHRKKKTEGH